MPRSAPDSAETKRVHVSLLALPDSMVSSLSGPFDVFSTFATLGTFDKAVPKTPPFKAEIISPHGDLAVTSSGLTLGSHRRMHEVRQTDVIILPSMMVPHGEWKCGRYPEVVEWLKGHHTKGAMLCSACSGVLLLAETGLLDGRDATIHWAFAPTFQRNFPRVHLRLKEVLIATGPRQEFVMSGASASWHDLVLYLIARHAGPDAAQAISRFMLLQWHRDGQAPYVPFAPPTDHGDVVVGKLQDWLREHHAVANPVEEAARRSGWPARTFNRRFVKATGLSPIAYTQHLRIEEAKRQLERTTKPIDEISYAVGYEDPASFRRLFRRLTQVTPGQYRRKFRPPALLASAGPKFGHYGSQQDHV